MVVNLISGCAQVNTKQFYENKEFGIKLEKPENWDATLDERSGTLVINTKTEILSTDSARMELHGGSCPPDPSNSQKNPDTSLVILDHEINRIGKLYKQDLISIVQKPINIENKGTDISKATITIPTIAMQDDLNRIQVGRPESDRFQTIDLFVIRDDKFTFIAEVYKGNNDVLNTQAQEIINSIVGYCSI